MSYKPMKDQDFNSFSKESTEIDLVSIFRFILMQSKLIIAITVLGFLSALLFNILSTKQYKIQSLIQYEAVNQNILDPTVSLQSTFRSSNTDISSLIALYNSRTNILKLIKDLKLNIDVEGLSENENIDINIKSNSDNEFSDHSLNFSFSKTGYTLLDSDKNQLAYSNYGEYIYYNDLEILINSSDISESKMVIVDYRNPENLYNRYASAIILTESVSRYSYIRNEGLITVSFITENPELGKRIINHANQIFLNQRITVETQKSRKALDFINTNLKLVERDFDNKKMKLNKFREKNQSIDVDLEIQGIVNKIEVLDRSLDSIDLAIAKAREVYTENNTSFLNLLNERKIIEKQKQDVMSLVKLMPNEQQEYIDLYNDVEVSQSLFEELETRRLGLSILEASTIGDIRIVDEAYYDSQVSPKFISVIIFTMLSLLIGCIVAILRGFFILPISNPAELFDNNIQIPVIGVFPFAPKTNLEQDLALNASIESLIVNLDSMNNDETKKNIISITSPTPGNGKSFSSVKLAEGYAELGKKVLLIDGDYKRGKLGDRYDKKSIKKEVFFSIDESNIENFITKENLYLIPRVRSLHNTFEFSYNSQYQQKIEFFRNYFDYIIIDTAPILSVADTSILVEKSDVNLLIVRHEITRLNEVKQVVEHFDQIGRGIDGIMYNAYKKPKSYYGYYGLYGNYSYKYYADKYLHEDYDYKK
jgi:tyrosine-protein kinase Etk/Wzc